MKKLNIAFVCVHNSCRSQMAEAIVNIKYSELLNAYSAGTALKAQINQDAVKCIERNYSYKMDDKYHSKLVSDLPEIDILVTMGCNVDCPMVKNQYRTDFGLTDPTGESDFVFDLTAQLIETKIENLIYKLKELNLIDC